MNATPPPSFILVDGRMPRGIADLARMPVLAGGTLDMWAYGKHRRAFEARLSFDKDKLCLTNKHIMRREGSLWRSDSLANFNHFLMLGDGCCVPSYTESGIICYTAAHSTPGGMTVQFALYPPTYPVGPGVLQVTRWQNAISPAMGTPTW